MSKEPWFQTSEESKQRRAKVKAMVANRPPVVFSESLLRASDARIAAAAKRLGMTVERFEEIARQMGH